LTAGESHGKGLIGILEGLPAGISLGSGDFAPLMARRWAGYGRSGRRRIETDEVEILSGVRFGKTLGSPLALLIRNRDYATWEAVMAVDGPSRPARRLRQPCPGHADLAGALRYRARDLRDIRERASARETAMRTALSVPARALLMALSIRSLAFVREIGGLAASPPRARAFPTLCQALNEAGDVFLTVDPAVVPAWRRLIDDARARGDTLGGAVEIRFWGLPPGLGSHTHWDRRLDTRLTAVLMGLPGVRAVEIGDGLEQSRSPGTRAHDAIAPGPGGSWRRPTNRAGGLEGGMTNGEPLVIRAFMKPPPSAAGLGTVDMATRQPARTVPERTDVAPLPALAIVAESVLALELASILLETFGGATLTDLRGRVKA